MQGHRHQLRRNSVSPAQASIKAGHGHIAFTNLAPQTPSELYWASRAQKAEALLAAREKHDEEIGRIRLEESSKRHIELEALKEKLGERERNLEKLKMILVGLVVLLVAVLVYFLSASRSIPQSSHFGQAVLALLYWPFGTLGLLNPKKTDSRSGSSLNFYFHFPSHLTLPILSPWTSVVEHQTSHVNHNSSNDKVSNMSFYLLFFLVVLACSLYISFRVLQNSCSASKFAFAERILPTHGPWQFSAPIFSAVLKWVWRWGYWLLYLASTWLTK